MAKTFVHTATVEGSGQFPYDMLRYDSCFPADEGESYGLDCHNHDRRQVRVTVVTDNRFDPFTAKRWESFMWKVMNVESRQVR